MEKIFALIAVITGIIALWLWLDTKSYERKISELPHDRLIFFDYLSRRMIRRMRKDKRFKQKYHYTKKQYYFTREKNFE